MIQRSFVLVTAFLLLGLGLPAGARVLPTLTDTPRFGVEFLRNLDEFDAHWGGNVGYCWRGRLDLRLEYRQDGILSSERLALQAEIALVKLRGFMLEAGYHHTLTTSRHTKYHLVPVRISFPIKAAQRLFITPNFTYWHVLADNSDALGFAGLDFLWDRHFVFALELNVNQDFRYHYLDIRLGYHW